MGSGASSRVPGDAGGRAESVPCGRDCQKAPPCSEERATRGKSERESTTIDRVTGKLGHARRRILSLELEDFDSIRLRSHCERSRTRRNWTIRVVAVDGLIWGGILNKVNDSLFANVQNLKHTAPQTKRVTGARRSEGSSLARTPPLSLRAVGRILAQQTPADR